MSELFVTSKLPILALRGMTVFPEQTVHFDVGRIKSVLALEEAMKHDQILMLVPQKNIMDDDPGLTGLYPIGTVVKVKQILKSQGENIRVLVTGLYRARLLDLTQNEPYLAGMVESASEMYRPISESAQTEAANIPHIDLPPPVSPHKSNQNGSRPQGSIRTLAKLAAIMALGSILPLLRISLTNSSHLP